MIKTIRDLLSVLILPAVLVWYIGVAILAWKIGLSILETLGFGTVGGVLLKMLSDTWTFYFRKKGETQNTEGDSK